MCVCFVMFWCVFVCGFCNVGVCVCVCGFCNVLVCVCGFCNVCVCFVMCGCVRRIAVF